MKEKLKIYRKKIDDIDEKIISLINQRAQTAIEIGKIKNNGSAPVYVPSREKEVLNNVAKHNKGPLSQKDIAFLYKEIMSICRGLEKKPVIAFLGPKGTNSHQAALNLFGTKCEYLACQSIPDVIFDTEKNKADFAVVPVENSNEGAVTAALDILVDTTLSVVNEINLKIEHCLASKTKFENIKVVYSHQQAISQCRDWLRKNLPEVEVFPVSSTAHAAQMASLNNKSAAICSQTAADLYKLPVIKKSIQDSRDNLTRFFILGNTKSKVTGSDKTSVIFSIKDKVSALHDILKIFADKKINLSKIESRPTKKKAWQYVFFVDFNGHIDSPVIDSVLKELQKQCVFLKVLGSYPTAD